MISWNVISSSVMLTKTDGSTFILNENSFIKFDGREDGVKIIKFYGKDPKGPIGMTYLPWRGSTWATPIMTLRGDPRFIICPPVGWIHPGQHIFWDSVTLHSLPEGG